MPESSTKLLEKVQNQCLKAIMGTSAHASSEAIEVIANIMPVRVRIEELCNREFLRIVQKSGIVNANLQSSAVFHNKFTPMSYIKYVARDFQKALDRDDIEELENENESSMNVVCELAKDISMKLNMSSYVCKSVVRKYCTKHWQRKWNISNSGRSTYDLMPTVGQKPLLPSYRNTAVSFIRILLQESVLHRRPYRLPTDMAHSCDCGHSVEDLEHFFLHCNQYDKARQKLTSAVTDVWNDSEQAEQEI